MKYGIITFHRAINYGAVFQTYALCETIKNQGYDCEVIDYRCEFLEKQYRKFGIYDLFNPKKIALILLKNIPIRDNTLNFENFRNKHLTLSERIYNSPLDLKESNNIYDVFITGSDQVWSYYCAGFDKSYFLDFVSTVNKKTSYAASFGVTSIPNEYKTDYIELLNEFNSISVREEQGAKLVKELTNENVEVVLDPTLLLSHKQWEKIAVPHIKNKKYILIYLLAESDTLFSFAKKIANEKNLEIIYIHDRLFSKKGVTNLNKVSPEEWLSLFKNAEMIITNSFHGICFSINFNKEFYVEFLPEPAKVNSRLENILKAFDLENRVINSCTTTKIDYEKVNKILEEKRRQSLCFIKEHIINVRREN